MSKDIETLIELNIEIAEAENRGDTAWLAGVLAPRLAFQRANGAVGDEDSFLRDIKPGGDRVTRIVEPIEFFGNRAVVQCVVTTRGREIHNLRLFVRRDGEWKLLGWANEVI